MTTDGVRSSHSMSLPKDFLEQLPLKTEAELYDLLAHQEDYLPEAVAAAKKEFSKRKLQPERMAQLEATVQSQNAAAEIKAQERLGWPLRIVILLFCSGLLGALLGVYYESKGYKKKASDCWMFMGISLSFHLFIGFVLFLTR